MNKETTIPFGASDSELMEATYFIPQGYHAVIDGNKVIITKGEEPVSNDLEKEIQRYYNEMDGDCRYMQTARHFARWQKERDQSTIELAEDHAMLAGMEKMRQEMIDKVCKWLVKHWREYVWLTNNDIIHFGHWEHDFKKAMEE